MKSTINNEEELSMVLNSSLPAIKNKIRKVEFFSDKQPDKISWSWFEEEAADGWNR